MVTVEYDDAFLKKIEKIREKSLRIRLRSQIAKIAEQPETGKPMRYERNEFVEFVRTEFKEFRRRRATLSLRKGGHSLCDRERARSISVPFGSHMSFSKNKARSLLLTSITKTSSDHRLTF